MVMTVLEAKVAPERAGDLERAFREATASIDDDLVETFLVRDARDTTTFRILTLWPSRQVLEAMRAKGGKPKGVQIFESAGATPTLAVLDVVGHAAKRGTRP